MNDLATLKQVLPQLKLKDQGFAESLIANGERRGHSTPREHVWVIDLIQRAGGAPSTAAGQTEKVTDGLDAIHKLFDFAKNRSNRRLKRPAIVFRAEDLGDLRINEGRIAGSLNVIREGDREWLGRIKPDGSFAAGRSLSQDKFPKVVEALKRFAADPAGVAAEYGHLTGKCCFCRIPLTDARSTKMGYGPICAENYGLPWGEKTRKVEDAELKTELKCEAVKTSDELFPVVHPFATGDVKPTTGWIDSDPEWESLVREMEMQDRYSRTA